MTRRWQRLCSLCTCGARNIIYKVGRASTDYEICKTEVYTSYQGLDRSTRWPDERREEDSRQSFPSLPPHPDQMSVEKQQVIMMAKMQWYVSGQSHCIRSEVRNAHTSTLTKYIQTFAVSTKTTAHYAAMPQSITYLCSWELIGVCLYSGQYLKTHDTVTWEAQLWHNY